MAGSLPGGKEKLEYCQSSDLEGRERAVPHRHGRSSNQRTYFMQLPDESITYQYQGLLSPAAQEWTPATELRAQHFLSANRLRDLTPRITQVRGQVAAERELQQVPPELQPLDAGFIDLPQKTLDQYRRQPNASVLGRVLALSQNLQEQVDRVVLLGVGGSYLGARAFSAMGSTQAVGRYHWRADVMSCNFRTAGGGTDRAPAVEHQQELIVRPVQARHSSDATE